MLQCVLQCVLLSNSILLVYIDKECVAVSVAVCVAVSVAVGDT